MSHMKWLMICLVLVGLCTAVTAEEGMWTFDHFPTAAVMERYGVRIDDAWLDKVQRSVVRLETGCTGSFVSPEGLVLTNHHCIQTCLADNSTADRDLVANGYPASSRGEETRCQGSEVSVLASTEEVTPQVTTALAGAQPADVARVRNQAFTTLESACEERSKASGAPLKCEVVTLYQGGQYWLYKYRRYEDVRLVFAPESGVAAFGGDPDNFQFPRWCLDVALLRVYENGKPASTPDHLSFNWSGAKTGEPVFVAGHPGTTQRLLTVAQLRTERDLFLPFWLLRFSELRGRLIQYSRTSPEAERRAKDFLDTIENSHKVRRMQLFSLLDDRMMEQKAAEEQKLRQAVDADPELKARAGTAWDDIARAQEAYRDILMPHTWIEGGAGFNSELFFIARLLVRAAQERTVPNAERLREFTDAQLPRLRDSLASETPVYPDLEEVRLTFSLERMREWLGPDHAIVQRALGDAAPQARAQELVSGSTLADPKVRLALFDGGQAAIAASKDPMIALARSVDEEARSLRDTYEREVQGPVQRAQQAIAEARFKVFGTALYPDATFTLRVSYGAVQGWTEAGTPVEPFTRLARMYERATGTPPFQLPRRWLDQKPKLDLAARANFVTTNDIIGGNSGSPMVNASGEIVGLVFDGNIHAISGAYWFDAEKNRTVAVHPDFIRMALTRVYSTEALATELRVPR